MGVQQTYRLPFAKFRAVRIAILLAAGIVVNYCFKPSLIIAGSLFFAAAAGLFGLEWWFSSSVDPRVQKLSVAGYLVLMFLFGITWHGLHEKTSRPVSADMLEPFVWEEVEIKGTVYNIKPTSTGNLMLDINVDTTTFGDSLHWVNSYNLRSTLDTEELERSPSLQLGSHIHLQSTIYPLEEPRNPHEFDYKAYLHSQNIYTQSGVEAIYSVTNNHSLMRWTTIRQVVLDLVDQNFSPQNRPLAKALLIGYKNELDPEIETAFSRAGLSHIMAVSGLHVGFIVAPFWIIIPWLWTLRYGKQTGLFALIALLVLYAGITGFPASVCRASLTAGLITYGRLFHKARSSINLTAVAAIILLLINPNDLFQVGFQLSFAAVFIILLTLPVINRWIPDWVQHRWYGTPLSIIIVSVVVQVGLFPILVWYFGEFSLIGPLANAVVVPLLGLVVPLALGLLLVTAVFPEMGSILNIPNDLFFEGLNHFINWTTRLEWGWIQVHLESPLIFLIWTAAVFAFASIYFSRLRWKMLALLLALLVVQSGRTLMEDLHPKQLQVTIFDVGQGDAALVHTPNDKHFLIDTGRWSPGYNSAEYTILPHLKAEGIKRLDAVFLSHPHSDHIGGVAELIREIPVDTIYNSGYRYDSNLYQRYLDVADKEGVPVRSLSAGDQIAIDPSILLLVYGPARGRFGDDPNEHSLVLELIYGQTEFLFVGDAGKEQEQRMLPRYGHLLDTDFLKVGHHGSSTSSGAAFLEVATPDISVTSLDKTNRFRHPHPEAVRRISQHSRQAYYTSLHKAMIFVSDGTKIRRIAW